MNVWGICTLISTTITHPLVHIYQKTKIAPKIVAKIASVKGLMRVEGTHGRRNEGNM